MRYFGLSMIGFLHKTLPNSRECGLYVVSYSEPPIINYFYTHEPPILNIQNDLYLRLKDRLNDHLFLNDFKSSVKHEIEEFFENEICMESMYKKLQLTQLGAKKDEIRYVGIPLGI